MAGSNRVTIEEIGERLNISTSTVSRALRQDPLIHPETRARVNTLAIDLGYQGRSRQGPNRGKRKNSLAVLFAVSSLAQVRNGFITTCYLQGLTTEAENAGIALNLHTVTSLDKRDFEETAGIPRSLWSGERDAVIVTGHHHDETIKTLSQKVPVVSLVWEYPDVCHDVVNTPDIAGMNMIVRELVRLGHRKLAWTGTPMRGSFVESRKASFIHACLTHQVPIADITFFEPGLFAESTVAHPERLMEALRSGVTAFICASDHAAELVLATLKSAGVKVPQEASVTGFDHTLGHGTNGSNMVTSIDPQFIEMGRTAIRLARWRVEQPSAFPMTLTLRARFVPGASTGPAPAPRKQ